MTKHKKWTDVYPQGTKEGDEEVKFFKTLVRTKYSWRSTSMLIKASGLSMERVEEIISKYASMNPPLIYPNPKNEEQWGYWENVKDDIDITEDNTSISKKDKRSRVDKHLDTGANSMIKKDDDQKSSTQ